jgi:hypothetical protein
MKSNRSKVRDIQDVEIIRAAHARYRFGARMQKPVINEKKPKAAEMFYMLAKRYIDIIKTEKS